MNSILSILMSVLSVIAPCIVFGTCCYFLAKKNVVEAILMTIGSGIGILIHLFYILLPLWISSRNIPYTEISKYYTLIGIIGALANICFAAGFLILIINTIKKNTVTHDQFPKSID
jgi:Na+-transporting NADH:ubiquinone oxidoreductase subunit NqrD